MKLSIAIADTHALPSAFVVYRGFEECIPKAARLGYHGVELALKNAEEIDIYRLRELLDANEIEVSCISTGQVYADSGLMFTHEEKAKRRHVTDVFKKLVDLAAEFGKLVNIGRVRGPVNGRSRENVEELFIEVAREICDYAYPSGVSLILEPVNRYEIDFINNIEEGVGLMKKIDRSNMKLMPDLFHMNIEDRKMGEELSRHIQYVEYLHVADSNRLAPGQGHTDFNEIFEHLLKAGFDGWVSAEILPRPDPDTAAEQTANFMLPLVNEYNHRLGRQVQFR